MENGDSVLTAQEQRSLRCVAGMMIPASADTRGHGTTGMAKFYKRQIEELLATAPRGAM